MTVADELEALSREVARSLGATESPHATAVSWSAVYPEDLEANVFRGGSVVAPAKPPFSFSNETIAALHRHIYEVAGKGVIHSVIVHASRADAGTTTWETRARAITMDEHTRLMDARRSIDTEIESELRAVAASEPWEMMAFGKPKRQETPVLSRRPPGERLVSLDPGAPLLELYARAERVYAEQGLALIVAYWSLENRKSAKLEFREYFE